jgi:hypothetical protein
MELSSHAIKREYRQSVLVQGNNSYCLMGLLPLLKNLLLDQSKIS